MTTLEDPGRAGLLARLCDVNGKLYLLLALCVLFLVPLRIIAYNFNPPDDVNRHVAKAVSGRAWSDILVLRPGMGDFDHNPGWHRILAGLHALGMDKEDLRTLSVAGLAIVFLLTGQLLYARAPLAWGIALLLGSTSFSIARVLLGRPYILSAAVLMGLLALWREEGGRRLRRAAITAALIALAAWVHGAWHLFALFPASLALARRYRDAAAAGAAWLAGSLAAALATGVPVDFLYKQLAISALALNTADAAGMLVTEFHPIVTPWPVLLALLGFAALRLAGASPAALLRTPAAWLALLGWTLGMRNGRFWNDWGAPAYLVLLADLARAGLERLDRFGADLRLAGFGVLTLAAMYLGHTADVGSRWNNSTLSDALSLEDPAHRGWLPDPGGILYSDSMLVYYETFFANPNGPWRYILGHEPGLMPEEDLRIYREIQRYRYDDLLLKPWAEKLRPEDRLVLSRPRSSKPGLPELEWNYAAFHTWVGRRPRAAAP